MKKIVTGVSAAVIGFFASHHGTSVQAFQVVNFDNMTSNPATTASSYQFVKDGVTLKVSNPIGNVLPGSTPGAAFPLNTNPSGLCAFALIGTGDGRCGSFSTGVTPLPDPEPSQFFAPGSSFNGFALSFDKPGFFNSVAVTQLAAITANTQSITFTSGSSTQTFTNFTATSPNNILTFTQPFVLGPNSKVFVITSGESTNNFGGNFRINNVNFTADVPGPAAYLGIAAAFQFSRRLKAKISKKLP